MLLHLLMALRSTAETSDAVIRCGACRTDWGQPNYDDGHWWVCPRCEHAAEVED